MITYNTLYAPYPIYTKIVNTIKTMLQHKTAAAYVKGIKVADVAILCFTSKKQFHITLIAETPIATQQSRIKINATILIVKKHPI